MEIHHPPLPLSTREDLIILSKFCLLLYNSACDSVSASTLSESCTDMSGTIAMHCHQKIGCLFQLPVVEMNWYHRLLGHYLALLITRLPVVQDANNCFIISSFHTNVRPSVRLSVSHQNPQTA